MPKWQWIYKQISSRLWLRAAMFCLLGVCSALVSSYFGRYLPEGLEYKIGAKSIEMILNILASSMMAATTFSLSVMVSSYAAVQIQQRPELRSFSWLTALHKMPYLHLSGHSFIRSLV